MIEELPEWSFLGPTGNEPVLLTKEWLTLVIMQSIRLRKSRKYDFTIMTGTSGIGLLHGVF